MPNVEAAKARGHFGGWRANHRLPRGGTGGAIYDPVAFIDQTSPYKLSYAEIQSSEGRVVNVAGVTDHDWPNVGQRATRPLAEE